jgi:ABC-type Fe3+/spermidine/putrescine transport system ATPase subunit
VSVLLHLEGISKHFGATVALEHIDLEVEEGELVTLLGPSGCGKTTLLRIVAGFERPTSGRVTLEGRDITYDAAHKRPVNTVFQRYLLFPHLSVFENVAFGLRVSGLRKGELAERVRDALALVRLSGFEERRSDQLSGGQAQRVSLARALVNRPKLLLLDEPLSALDLKVRLEMQAELRRIHRETGTTFLYVTHDQQEAMSLSDRVAVMSHGRIEQASPPAEIYHRPTTRFVAQFVGDANLLPVQVLSSNGRLTRVLIREIDHEVVVAARLSSNEGWLVLRPEVLRVEEPGGPGIRGSVADVAFLGSSVTYRIDAGGVEIRVQEIGRDIRPRFAVGDAVTVAYEPDRCLLLSGEEAPEAVEE